MKKVGSIRPEFLNGPILYGKKIKLFLPTNEQREGQFAIVELNDILASHNHHSFGDTVGYPKTDKGQNINDRNYTGDLSAQAAVRGYAQNLIPERVISTSREESGTPVITTDGFVVSGNNRTMSVKLAAEEYPVKYDNYKTYLVEEAAGFGFSPSTIRSVVMGENIVDDREPGETFRDNKYIRFENPVLVRFDYDFPEYTTGEMAKYNKGSMKIEKMLDKVIKLSKILEASPQCTEIIAGIIGQYENASEFFEVRRSQKELAEQLINCNILTRQELPAYFDNGTFTRVGKDFVENLLAAMVLSENALIASNKAGVKKFRNVIITSLLVLTKNAQLNPGSLKEAINQALILQLNIVNSGLEFQDYMLQTGLWEQKINYKAAYLNRLLSKGQRIFKGAIEGYNKTLFEGAASIGMFGDQPTPESTFQFYVINAIDPEDKNIIESSGRVTADPVELQMPIPNKSKEKARARARARIRLLELVKTQTIEVTKGHLTATEKKHIKALLDQNLMEGKINRKSYFIKQDGDEYTVKIVQTDRGIGLIGAPLRESSYTHKFKLK